MVLEDSKIRLKTSGLKMSANNWLSHITNIFYEMKLRDYQEAKEKVKVRTL